MFESAEKTDVKFSFINYETAKNLCLKMQENSLKISNTKKGYVISGEVSLNGNLFISKITNKNLVLKSNDKNIEQQNIFYEFSSIKVQSGTVKVEASYSSMSQSLLWIAVALIGIVFASLIIVLQKTNRLTVLQTAIYHGFRVLNYSILLIFYIFGIILSVFVILL